MTTAFRSLALPRINDAGVVAYAGTLADGTMEIRTSDDSIMLATDPSATIFADSRSTTPATWPSAGR